MVIFQNIYSPGISLADASILCTALGGDHNKVPIHVKVVNPMSLLLLFLPDITYITDNNLMEFLYLYIPCSL